MTKRQAVRYLMQKLGDRYFYYGLRHRLYWLKQLIPSKYDYQLEEE